MLRDLHYFTAPLPVQSNFRYYFDNFCRFRAQITILFGLILSDIGGRSPTGKWSRGGRRSPICGPRSSMERGWGIGGLPIPGWSLRKLELKEKKNVKKIWVTTPSHKCTNKASPPPHLKPQNIHNYWKFYQENSPFQVLDLHSLTLFQDSLHSWFDRLEVLLVFLASEDRGVSSDLEDRV